MLFIYLDYLFSHLKNNYNTISTIIMLSQQCLISSETEGKRARELFEALDDDGNGTLDEEEFVQVDKVFCWLHFELPCDKAL